MTEDELDLAAWGIVLEGAQRMVNDALLVPEVHERAQELIESLRNTVEVLFNG